LVLVWVAKAKFINKLDAVNLKRLVAKLYNYGTLESLQGIPRTVLASMVEAKAKLVS